MSLAEARCHQLPTQKRKQSVMVIKTLSWSPSLTYFVEQHFLEKRVGKLAGSGCVDAVKHHTMHQQGFKLPSQAPDTLDGMDAPDRIGLSGHLVGCHDAQGVLNKTAITTETVQPVLHHVWILLETYDSTRSHHDSTAVCLRTHESVAINSFFVSIN